MPALLTSTSSRGWLSSNQVANRRTESPSARSSGCEPPLRVVVTTVAPQSASSRAVSPPIEPGAVPVTRTVLPDMSAGFARGARTILRCSHAMAMEGRPYGPDMQIPLGEVTPQVDPSAWVAPDAVIVGDVSVGPEASVWFTTVIRGDGDAIRIGARSNIQD